MAPGRRDALIVTAGAVGAVVAGGLAGALALQSRSGASELLSARFVDLSGRTRQILEWRGRVVLCNFWATWCEPCQKEIPLLSAAEQQYRSSGLSVVGIGIDRADKISQFSSKYKVTYVTLIGDGNTLDLLKRLGDQSAGLPFSVVLDRNGAIAHRRLGAYEEKELNGLLETMLR